MFSQVPYVCCYYCYYYYKSPQKQNFLIVHMPILYKKGGEKTLRESEHLISGKANIQTKS